MRPILSPQINPSGTAAPVARAEAVRAANLTTKGERA